jgi:hypothetical protein
VAKKSKPADFQNFESLTQRLLDVPKDSLDRQVSLYNAKKKAKKRIRKR